MATYPATMDVAITNWPPTVNSVSVLNQPVDVSEDAPGGIDILFGSRTTTGLLFTVPAGRVWRGSVSLAASVSVAGNAGCSVSAATGGIIHQIPLSGLALSVASQANTLDNVYIHGGASGNAVTFTAGAAGSSSGSASGRLL